MAVCADLMEHEVHESLLADAAVGVAHERDVLADAHVLVDGFVDPVRLGLDDHLN